MPPSPSLRRTFSSPSVRASPYPTAFSNSLNAASGRVNGQANRRSSGSETTGRRVLADLEWWRVVDGQHAIDGEVVPEDQEQVQDEEQEQPSLNIVSDEDVERPSTPVNWSFESSQEVEV